MGLPAVPYPAEPLPKGRLLRRGKVRDLYETDDGRLIIVASDRISAFDVVLSPGIAGKGLVLTQMSNFWFDTLGSIVDNHVVATDLAEFPAPYREQPVIAGRSNLVRRVDILPVECVVRGYIVGSGWKEYQRSGSVCGIPLPAGLAQADALPEPIFTPSTKAEVGHDENISFDRMVETVGGERAERVRALSLELYRTAASYARERGIIIADTKFEFGIDGTGSLVLADEALTPDSSRFWPADEYRPGTSPPSFDKQYVRDWLEASGWDKQPPAPELPDEVVRGTQDRYLEAYRRLTGREIDAA